MMDGYVSQAPREEDWGLQKAQNWQLKRCWRPETCFLTGVQLWGKKAYRGLRIITGPGEPIHEYYWVEKNEFILWKLKY